MQALGRWNEKIEHLSEADDTLYLQSCLHSDDKALQVGEGGTTFRFLLAFLCLKNELKTLSGAGQLAERPLAALLEALQHMGARFSFSDRKGKLPVRIEKGIDLDFKGSLEVDSSQSSQFVSALLLIAPYLHHGLLVKWSAKGVSEPYIHMTLQLMQQCGIAMELGQREVQVYSGAYAPRCLQVESDWSGAAFFLAWLALQDQGSLFFPDLQISGLQADQAAMDFFIPLGLSFMPQQDGMMVMKNHGEHATQVSFDFTNCPDLFPAIALFCALSNCSARFTGLQHLDHKESKRLTIVKTFLEQHGARVHMIEQNEQSLVFDFNLHSFQWKPGDPLDSHRDHRLAMAFGLLQTQAPVRILDPECVSKSFPEYWKQMHPLVKFPSHV